MANYAPLWAMVAVSSVLMAVLGGDHSLVSYLRGTYPPPPTLEVSGVCSPLARVHYPIYRWLDSVSGAMIVWTSLSLCVTLVRFGYKLRAGVLKLPDSILFTEGAGLLLTLAQLIVFAWAVIVHDWLTAALFAWWGPGFWVTVYHYLKAEAAKRRINWNQPACPFAPGALGTVPLKLPIAWACKLCYVLYMAVFTCLGMKQQVFAFSVWIVNDNLAKAVLEQDADRARRTMQDGWVVRVCYVLGLALPFTRPDASAPAFNTFCCVLGATLGVAYVAAVAHLLATGTFLDMPESTSLLRNIMLLDENGEYIVTGPRVVPPDSGRGKPHSS